MADQAFQYIKLPDGSYGKFAGDATDDVIRTQVMKDFPDAFGNGGGTGDRTLTPPSVMNKRTPPGSEHMRDQYLFGNDSPEPIMPQDIIAGTAKDAYTMTRAGYQHAAKGIATGLLHRPSAPLGEPPSQDEFLNAAKNIGTGMVMGGIEGEGMAPAASRLTRTADSAPPPTSESFAPRVPPIRGRSSPVSAGGGGAEFASDMIGLVQPKWMKALGLMKKWMGRGAEAEPEAATYNTPKAEWGKPGYYGNAAPTTPSVRGAPAYQGKSASGTPVPSVLEGQPPVKMRTIYPEPPVTRPPRPEPAWKRLTKGESNSGGAGPETGGDAVISNPFDSPEYQNSSRVLTRGNQGGANYSADDLIAFKKKHGVTDIPAETPSHQPGETATSTAAEIKRLDKDGGQLGQPPATAKLQKFPMTGVKAVGEINPHPRKYYPDNPDAVTDEDVNVAARLKKKGPSQGPVGTGPGAMLRRGADLGPTMRPGPATGPGKTLYHGTRASNVDSILKEGIKGGAGRNQAYLTTHPGVAEFWSEQPTNDDLSTREPGAIIEATVPQSAIRTTTRHPEDLTDKGLVAQKQGEFRMVTSGSDIPPALLKLRKKNTPLDNAQAAERSGEVGGGENIEKLKWRLMKSMKVIGDTDTSVGAEPYNKFVKATGFDHLQDEGAWFHRNADDAQFEKFTQLVNGIKDPSDVSMVVKQLRQIRGATTRLRKK